LHNRPFLVLLLILLGVILLFTWSVIARWGGFLMGSIVAVAVWAVPYIFGKMYYHILYKGAWRFIGWLFVLLIIVFIVAAFIRVALSGAPSSGPNLKWLGFSIDVMLLQFITWGLTWLGCWRVWQTSRWRPVSAVASMTSLLFLAMAVYSFYGTRVEEYQSQVFSEQRYDEQLARMVQAGYEPYPGAAIPQGDYISEGGGGNSISSSKSLSIKFNTPDSVDQVLDFYKVSAKKAGMKVHKGYSRLKGFNMRPDAMLLGTRGDGAVIEVSKTPFGQEWIVIVTFFDNPEQIDAYAKRYEWVNP
jgi:hypothetical protein